MKGVVSCILGSMSKSNFNDADEELLLFYVSDDDLERASVACNGGVPTLVGTYCMTCPAGQEIAN
jgi:hypothetical protein